MPWRDAFYINKLKILKRAIHKGIESAQPSAKTTTSHIARGAF
jgi:hypothetical protein